MTRLSHTATALVAALVLVAAPVAAACTRAVYLGPEDRVLTGRSMDWKLPIVSNLWAFPRGMDRDGAAGERSVQWTSTFGSLAVSGYDIATAGNATRSRRRYGADPDRGGIRQFRRRRPLRLSARRLNRASGRVAFRLDRQWQTGSAAQMPSSSLERSFSTRC